MTSWDGHLPSPQGNHLCLEDHLNRGCPEKMRRISGYFRSSNSNSPGPWITFIPNHSYITYFSLGSCLYQYQLSQTFEFIPKKLGSEGQLHFHFIRTSLSFSKSVSILLMPLSLFPLRPNMGIKFDWHLSRYVVFNSIFKSNSAALYPSKPEDLLPKLTRRSQPLAFRTSWFTPHIHFSF